MPPCLAVRMADYQQENAKRPAKGRKTAAIRNRGSPRQSRRPSAMQCCSPGRSTPPGGEDICLQTQSYSWPTNTEIEDTHFVDAYRDPAEVREGAPGQSPSKTGTARSTFRSQMAPAPASLPRPPLSWMAEDNEKVTVIYSDIPDVNVGSVLSNQLKMLLKVQG